ncbi:aromatic amino acid lyase [Arthrobacter sp. R1-13]
MSLLEIDGATLALADIASVAAGGVEVHLTPDAIQRMEFSRRAARETAARRPVYGRSTGVGANRSIALEPENLAGGQQTRHGINLLRSHAADAGEALGPEIVRAMLVVRLSQLAAGASGIDPAIAQALVRLLNDDTLPEVREFGGIGTADLPALAGTALTLLGERPPMGDGRLRTRLDVWDSGDALPFISSNALTIARAALSHQRLERLLHNAVTISALSFIALSGNAEAFSPAVAAAADTKAVAVAANTLRLLVEGRGAPARIQDPYCLRTLPQVFGSQLEELSSLRELLARLVVAGHENPMVHGWQTDGASNVSHHGLFQMTNLARRIDTLQIAVGSACATNLRRINLLCDPAHTDLNRFLAADDAGQSGVMALEYVAAAAVGRIRANSHPASLQTVVLSLGAEEDASFASVAVEQLESTVQALPTVLGIELLCAIRAIRLQGHRIDNFSSPRLKEMMAAGLDLDSNIVDRDLRKDLDAATNIVLRDLGA